MGEVLQQNRKGFGGLLDGKARILDYQMALRRKKNCLKREKRQDRSWDGASNGLTDTVSDKLEVGS